MANIKEQVQEKVTFYAVRPDGQVPAEWPNIYWPFSAITDGHTPIERNQDKRDAAKNVRFENGHFTTQDPDQIWLLDHYNSGGTYVDKKGNEYYYGWDRYLIKITREDPYAEKTKFVEKKIETVKEVVKYPRAVLESMDPKQLMVLCVAANLDTSSVDQTAASLIKLMESNDMIM